jgi:hypothetical protein
MSEKEPEAGFEQSGIGLAVHIGEACSSLR